jgi:hypothetical protein
MQAVFSQRLLAGLRTRTSEDEHRTHTFQDPDDRVDPDDSGPRLSVTLKEPVGEIYALPAAPAEQKSGRYPYTGDQSKAPQSPLGARAATAATPAMPDLLGPVVLRTMPPQVAAFMLCEPPERPPWRRQKTAGQRETREELEELGCWCG